MSKLFDTVVLQTSHGNKFCSKVNSINRKWKGQRDGSFVEYFDIFDELVTRYKPPKESIFAVLPDALKGSTKDYYNANKPFIAMLILKISTLLLCGEIENDDLR